MALIEGPRGGLVQAGKSITLTCKATVTPTVSLPYLNSRFETQSHFRRTSRGCTMAVRSRSTRRRRWMNCLWRHDLELVRYTLQVETSHYNEAFAAEYEAHLTLPCASEADSGEIQFPAPRVIAR